MSSLRDDIIRQVERAHSFVGDDWHFVDNDEAADAILALVRDALMSDAAIDAMLYRSYGWADYDEGTTYLDLPEDEKADIRDMGRHEIEAALAVAGISKGEDDA